MWRDEPLLLIGIGTNEIQFCVSEHSGALSDERFHVMSIPDDCGERDGLSGVAVALDLLVQKVLNSGPKDAGMGKASNRQRCRLRVLVADPWLSIRMVPWNRDLADSGASVSYVLEHLGTDGFDVSRDDAVCVEYAPYDEPCPSVVYPGALMSSLRHAADRLNAILESVVPVSVAAGEYLEKSVRNLLVITGEYDFSLLTWHGETISLTSHSARTDRGDRENALLRQWRRMSLRDPWISNMEQVKVIDLFRREEPLELGDGFARVELRTSPVEGRLPVLLELGERVRQQVHILDAVQKLPRLGAFHKSLSAIAITTIIAAGILLFRIQANLEEERTKVLEFNESISSKETERLSRDERVRIQAVNDAIRRLNLPVSKLLRAMNPPQEMRVALLGIEIASTNGYSEKGDSKIKLTAEARSGMEMTQYIHFLSEQEPFLGAYLLHHEVIERERNPYRFTVEAIWRE